MIVFDELVNYPEFRGGELLALWETCRTTRGGALRLLGHSLSAIEEHPTKEHNPQAVALMVEKL